MMNLMMETDKQKDDLIARMKELDKKNTDLIIEKDKKYDELINRITEQDNKLYYLIDLV